MGSEKEIDTPELAAVLATDGQPHTWMYLVEKYTDQVLTQAGIVSFILLVMLALAVWLFLGERKRATNYADQLMTVVSETSESISKLAMALELLKERITK